MENMHVILDALLADQHEAVLATIVQVEASAYRKAEALNGCGNIKIGTGSIVLTAFCQRVERPLLMN
ncbi:N-acetylmuramoyl-L-alanine amidase CwlA [Bacillus atrophaeus subsp. globigii]|uniref:Xanthine dehydrogenase molybdopterin recruitment factor n=1 Tax=Bacillus atrophaeus (strain 1942) TaxID=720555 RepID=A0ABM5M0V1_BACA1|nr:xanthine dehydrogenase molybdopterin recruitment factor [Bacillus atrophaeus 1942]AIK47647.1 N-acetylmuramoyl-L-alanine amidase CwlA [Bacillus atrophaeus subsp. globigii]AMR61533.1 xanthine dehydrogenase [Bacillus subtilis subsp. globigii]EIM10679.1 xanthine dehydrogenase molybdopterin recruitment factor [Bacillus atrophaeus C89]KFK83692.1 N-acetylmuramoyl-L-alanine amidase CwlA [Bacillus atrophaeus]